MSRAARPRRLADVVAMPGYERPEDAVKYVIEEAARGTLKGVVLCLIMKNGNVDIIRCGQCKNDEVVWAGTEMIHNTMR